jgi:hypothetical protein
MRTIILLLMLAMAMTSASHGSDIATLDKATFDGSLSLWRDNTMMGWDGIVDGENQFFGVHVYGSEPYQADGDGGMVIDTAEDRARYNYWLVTWLFFGSVFILFLTAKWAYLAIMLTDYEKFIWEMRSYYYRHYGSGGKSWPEGYHFPYDEVKASSYLLNFRVWTVRQALDAFTYFDYMKWCENKDWRPEIR